MKNCFLTMIKKKELSNIKIETQYKKIREKLKKQSELLIKEVRKVKKKFRRYDDQYDMNPNNRGLIKEVISRLDLFEEEMASAWGNSLTKDTIK